MDNIKISRINDTFNCTFNIRDDEYIVNGRIDFYRKTFKIIIYKKKELENNFYALTADDILYTSTIDLTQIFNQINRDLSNRISNIIRTIIDFFIKKETFEKYDTIYGTDKLYVACIYPDFSNKINEVFVLKDDTDAQKIILDESGKLVILLEDEFSFMDKLYKDGLKTYSKNKQIFIFSKTVPILKKTINSIINYKIKSLKKEIKFLDIQKLEVEHIISEIKSFKV